MKPLGSNGFLRCSSVSTAARARGPRAWLLVAAVVASLETSKLVLNSSITKTPADGWPTRKEDVGLERSAAAGGRKAAADVHDEEGSGAEASGSGEKDVGLEHAAAKAAADVHDDEGSGSLASGSVEAPLTFPPPPSQWLSDISSPLLCGVKKCFFHSKMSQARQGSDPEQTQYGYILTQKHLWRSGQRSDLVQELSDRFRIKHFERGPSWKFEVNAKQMAALDVKNLKHATTVKGIPVLTEEDGPLVVQPIELFSKDSILFGCFRGRSENSMEALQSLTHRQKHLTTLQLKSFEERVRFDLNATRSMLHSAEGACLWADFQLFLDTNTGSLHHLDFDRCKQRQTKDWKRVAKERKNVDCMWKLEKFLNAAYKQRGGERALFAGGIGTACGSGEEDVGLERAAAKAAADVRDNERGGAEASGSVEAPLTFPPPPSQWLSDISSPLLCGSRKCAFRSRMSRARQGGDPEQTQYGYLVTQNQLVCSRQQADVVRELTDRFGIKHFERGPPRMFNVDDEQMAALGTENLTHYRRSERPVVKALQDKYAPLVVQPIELAPKDIILFGCFNKKSPFAMAELQSLTHPKKHLTTLQLKSFEERVRFDLNATLSALHSAEGACLWVDFQLFLDTNTGSLYHLDFDACKKGQKRSWKWLAKKQMNVDCMGNLKKFLNAAYKQRGGTRALFDATVP